jgi:hypothetical protein
MQGCGGGGSDVGSQAPAPAPAPAPTPAVGDFLRVGISSSNVTAGKTVVFFDADRSEAPRLTVTLEPGQQVSPLTTRRADPVNHTFTDIGESAAYFVQNGQVYRVGLKKTEATVARRVSSITTACWVSQTDLLNSDETGWLGVMVAGPSGVCGTFNDRTVYVRPTDSESTAPVVLPEGVMLLSALPDPSFTHAIFMLVSDSRSGVDKLTLYRPDLTPAADVAGGEAASGTRMLSSFPVPGRHWVAVNNQLKVLTWNSSGATLSPAVLPSFAWHTPSLVDAEALYFVDGFKIQRITNEGALQTLATLNAGLGSQIYLKGLAPNHLVVSQTFDSSDGTSLIAVPKRGGTAVTVGGGRALGISGNTLYFEFASDAFTPPVSAVYKVTLDGTPRSNVGQNARGRAQAISSRTFSDTNDRKIDGVLWCEATPASAVNCANGTVKMLDARTGTVTTLGHITHDSPFAEWETVDSFNPFGTIAQFSHLTMDAPFVFHSRSLTSGADSILQFELYHARPGVAGSLMRLSPSP